MDKSKLTVYGIALFVIITLCNLGLFVKFSDMQAYAVSKSEFSLIREDLRDIKADQKDMAKDQKTLLNKFYEVKK